MTQEELAKAAEVSPRTVSDLERGVNKSAQKATAELLADGLGLAGPERGRFVAAARGKLPAAEISSWAGELMLAAGLAGVPAGAGERYDDTEASSLAWIESALSRQFVGRAAELSALGGAWRDTRAGRRVLMLVAGEPGIGKTALTAELARQVITDGGLVLYGRWDEEVLAPYQAFREALADYALACPVPLLRRDLAGLAADIARLCPEPAQRIGVSAAGPLAAAEAERFRLFGSL
jgi:transcriptional regulator with XRE-family HTH domain